jgi:3-phosphoinositide dependent protein kinase-1
MPINKLLFLDFVLSYCSNGDLLSVIKRSGTLTLNRSRFYAAELVDALEFMHGKKIIHR